MTTLAHTLEPDVAVLFPPRPTPHESPLTLLLLTKHLKGPLNHHTHTVRSLQTLTPIQLLSEALLARKCGQSERVNEIATRVEMRGVPVAQVQCENGFVFGE